MADDAENHMIRLLEEIRAEMRERFDQVDARFGQVDESIADLTRRVDGNTLLLNMVGGVAADHERRIEELEKRAR